MTYYLSSLPLGATIAIVEMEQPPEGYDLSVVVNTRVEFALRDWDKGGTVMDRFKANLPIPINARVGVKDTDRHYTVTSVSIKRVMDLTGEEIDAAIGTDFCTETVAIPVHLLHECLTDPGALEQFIAKDRQAAFLSAHPNLTPDSYVEIVGLREITQ